MRALSFLRTVGAGAFGTVYQAELVSGRGFQRQVAVKVISARGPEGQMFLSRMRDEARLLGLLQDDAILKVLDMVRVDGRDAVVMEYIEGVDLDSLIRQMRGSAPPSRALAELGAMVAGALHRAHTATHPRDGTPLGVVHRDVKPANVMVTRNGGVRLLDFGVARARFEARESHTGQLVLGTLNYMAPEYIVTGEISPAADIFALGLTLYEAVTGQVFGQPKVRRDSHDKRKDERMAALGAVSPELVPAITRFLDWDPDARPDGEEAERMLWDIANDARGSGLRQWASAAVPLVLAERGSSADPFGLVGRTVEIGEAAPDLPAAAAEAAAQTAPAAPAPPDPSEPVAQWTPPAAQSPQWTPPPAAPSPRPAPAAASMAPARAPEPPTAQTASPAPAPPAAPPPVSVVATTPPQPRPTPPPPADGGSSTLKTVVLGALLGLVVGGLVLVLLGTVAWLALGR
ncbi:MAG: serine/threonine protein kinase [Alphaproteobacteria bacterium]|nr:serine/threonine protein kinase [Alphaproteobacteria bacterium]